jgi:hypothetical protein
MDREEERLRGALDRAAPEVDEDGVMAAVVRKGRSLRRRRRLARGGGVVAAVVLLALIGFGVDRLVESLQTVPSVGVSSSLPEPGTSSPTTPVTTSSTTATSSSTTVTSSTTSSLATTTTGVSTTTSTTGSATSLEYRNTQYGFTFSLPADWKGYSIVTEKWQGFPINTSTAGSSTTGAGIFGPELLIRHPLWTATNPRQDIPIMVFTIAQWDLVQQMKLSVGAAPIAPSELGRNATYVFALPARYNYAFQTGYQEVETILAGKPLQGF